MPKFSYTAIAQDGSTVEGHVKARSLGSAKSAVAARDLQTLRIEEARSKLNVELKKKKVPREELMHLSRQLAAFVRAGIPLLEAVDVIADESTNPTLRRALIEIGDGVRAGERFSDALEAQRKVFPRFYVGIVRSAEVTGHLDTVLDQVASYLERDMEARRKIRAAMTYPGVIFVMSIVTIVVLTTFVMPRFKRFFASLNAKLPLPTRMLLGAESFLVHWWWAILGFVAVAGGALYLYVRTPRGRAARDRFVLGLPVVGETVRYAIVERFCRMLSSMVRAGVPLPEALVVTGEGTNNAVYAAAIDTARDAMMRGEGLARPLQRTELFPSAVGQMMRVGEDTGTLDQQLETAAAFYEQELDHKLKKLTSLFEPAIIVVMGGLVGFVAIAMISAMYGIFQQSTTIG